MATVGSSGAAASHAPNHCVKSAAASLSTGAGERTAPNRGQWRPSGPGPRPNRPRGPGHVRCATQGRPGRGRIQVYRLPREHWVIIDRTVRSPHPRPALGEQPGGPTEDDAVRAKTKTKTKTKTHTKRGVPASAEREGRHVGASPSMVCDDDGPAGGGVNHGASMARP